MRFVIAEIYVIRDLNDNGVVKRGVRPPPPTPSPPLCQCDVLLEVLKNETC